MKKLPQPPRDQDRAFILVTALILISAMVIIALSILSTARLQNSVTQFNYQNTRGELAVTPKLVPRLAFEHAAQGNDYVVLRVDVDGDADPLTPSEAYFYTARFNGSQWEYRPLFSGGTIPDPTNDLVLPTPSIRPASETEDIAGRQVTAQSALRIPQNQFGSPEIGWEQLAADEQSLPGDSELGEAELFYAYWIEDLGGRIDADVAGNSRGIPVGLTGVEEDFGIEDGFHYRGRGADASEIALFTLFNPSIREDGPDGTNDADNLIQTIRGQEGDLAEPFVNTILGAARSGAYPNYSAPPTDQWSGTETVAGIKDHLSFGTPEWTDRIEYVPKRPGFVHLDGNGDRIPKLALNPLIRRAESNFDEREKVIREIASHIQWCLPQFGITRTGGLPDLYAGNPVTEEEYLHNLAANIIDYADRDLTPSVGWDPDGSVPESEQTWAEDRSTEIVGGETIPGTSIGNRGWDSGDVYTPLYRGIDGQPFLVGLTNQFEYDIVKSRERSQGGAPTVVVDISTLIAVWNPFDFPISGVLRARLTEGWTTVKWGQNRPQLPHLNLPEPGGATFVSLEPNEFRVLPWIDHTELESEGSGSTLPNSVLIDDFGFRLFEAGYQIYWCDEELWTNWSSRGMSGNPQVFLADRSRFPDVMNRDFRRFVRQGEWWYFSSGIGHSSDNRYPVPPSSLYSAGNRVRDGRAYIPSAVVDNLWLFSGGAARTQYGDRVDPGQWGDRFTSFSDSDYGTSISRNADIFKFLEPTSSADREKAPLTVKLYPNDYSSFPMSYSEGDYRSLPEQRNPSTYYEELPGAGEYTGPGYYESLTELGNVYDPGCWTPQTSGSLRADHLGLGATLKIGEPEYDNFNSSGIRAQDLLDLFVLDYPSPEAAELADPSYAAAFNPIFPSGEWRTSRKGRININTATPEALRALVAGLRVRNPSGAPGEEWLYPRATERIGDEFANALISHRPFSSSILSSTSFAQSFLNNPASTYESPSGILTSRTREAFIDSLTNLTTVTSRVFRVHLSTYVVDRKPQSTGSDFRQIVSRKARVYDLFLEPQYDDTGNVTGQKLIVFHEKDL